MSLRPQVMRRLMRELAQLKSNPSEGIRVSHPEDNMLDVTGIIEGPQGTPYEGGYFKVKFNFTEEFPQAPPKCRFLTKIFHPNVSSAGEICVNTLKKDWQPTFGIEHILVTVKCLLIYPNPESALDEDAGRALLEDYEQYCMRARTMTSVHAMMKTRPIEFETPSSSSPSTASSSKTVPSNASSSSTPSTARKNLPAPQTSPSSTAAAQPLLPSSGAASNTTPSLTLIDKEKEKDKETSPTASPKDMTKSPAPPPAPLGPADANVAAGTRGGGANITKSGAGSEGGVEGSGSGAAEKKSVKRPAVGGSGAVEKRKKALKRL